MRKREELNGSECHIRLYLERDNQKGKECRNTNALISHQAVTKIAMNAN